MLRMSYNNDSFAVTINAKFRIMRNIILLIPVQSIGGMTYRHTRNKKKENKIYLGFFFIIFLS
jgi:hypothetical protein